MNCSYSIQFHVGRNYLSEEVTYGHGQLSRRVFIAILIIDSGGLLKFLNYVYSNGSMNAFHTFLEWPHKNKSKPFNASNTLT